MMTFVAVGSGEEPGRFLLFAGDIYYPAGGARDLVGVFATEDEAVGALAGRPFDWAHLAEIRPDGHVAIVGTWTSSC